MKTVHILVDRNRFEHFFFFELRRQGQLHEDAMHGVVGVEFGDLVEDELGVGVGRVVKAQRTHAGFFAAGDFIAHIHRRGGIVADQNDDQARRHAARLDFLDAFSELGANIGRQGVAVENAC